MDGAVGAVVEELHAADRPDLEAQAAAGLRAVLPVLRDPPGQVNKYMEVTTGVRTEGCAEEKEMFEDDLLLHFIWREKTVV